MRNIFNLFSAMMAVNLQLFAEAGTLVNSTEGYVNAYTGDVQPFDAQHTLDPQLKTYYDTGLLENARCEIIYGQFAKRQALPAGNGKTVEFRKWNTFQRAGKLQEGVIPTAQPFGSTSKTATIEQYGTFTAVTDVLDLRAYDPVIMGATEEMGGSAAETQEVLIRDALMTNTNTVYCFNVDLETGKVVGEQPTSCAELEASPTVMAKLTPDMVARIVTSMKKNRVPTIDGKYVAVIHPSVAYDLRKSEEWIEAHKYSATKEIFQGEIGELHGCRFIENSFAPILGGEDYTNKAGTVTYATHFFGKDAFVIIDPEGGALEVIVKDRSQIGGPLNQFSTIGYKLTTNGGDVLYVERLVCCMSTSTFSSVDQPN